MAATTSRSRIGGRPGLSVHALASGECEAPGEHTQGQDELFAGVHFGVSLNCRKSIYVKKAATRKIRSVAQAGDLAPVGGLYP